MAAGFKVDYDELDALRSALDTVIAEFDNAGVRRRDLEQAVARPYGFGELRDAAGTFEDAWDIRRGRLRENCQAVSDHAKSLVEGTREGDADMGSQFDEGAA